MGMRRTSIADSPEGLVKIRTMRMLLREVLELGPGRLERLLLQLLLPRRHLLHRGEVAVEAVERRLVREHDLAVAHRPASALRREQVEQLSDLVDDAGFQRQLLDQPPARGLQAL